MRPRPDLWPELPGRLFLLAFAVNLAAPPPARAQRTWDVVLAGAPADGRIPVLDPRTEMTECNAEYELPDSVALVSDGRSLPPPVWRWSDGTRTGHPNYGWRPVGGASVPDTIRVAVVGPVCDGTLRGRSRRDLLTQLLLERDGAIFSIGVEAVRTHGLADESHREVFFLDEDGEVARARLEEVRSADGAERAFALRPYDPVALRNVQVARRDSLRDLRQRRQAAAERRQAAADSIAAENRRRRAERRDSIRDAEFWAWREGVAGLAARHGWDPEMRALVLRRQVGIGMDETMVRTAWGSPRDVNRTTTARGIREQWVYGDLGSRRYIYFEDGVVSAIQN